MNQNQNYHNWNQMQTDTTQVNPAAIASKTFMTQVFAWMSGALMITAVTSWLFGNVEALMSLLYEKNYVDGGYYLSNTPLGWVVMLSPIAFILMMNIGFNKFSHPVLVALFLTFSAVMGASLGYVFIFFTEGSIFATFIVCAGMFGVMAVMGFITKADLSGFGSILMMGMVGLAIAMLVNFFMQSEMLFYIISFAGVAIFTGLTAYNVQALKNIGANLQGDDVAAKMSILGALTLYMTFINLFLFLLRLMGSRK